MKSDNLSQKSKNGAENIRLQNTYRIFSIWKSIPRGLLSSNDPLLTDLGLEQEMVKTLTGIRSQKEFAKHYKVSQDTLSDWNKKVTQEEIFINTKRMLSALTPKILFAFAKKTELEGDVGRVKLWMQIVENWQERVSIHQAGVHYQLSPEERQRLQDILERNRPKPTTNEDKTVK